MRRVIAGLFLAVLIASPALGQSDDKKVTFNIGGGPTFVVSNVGKHFGTGGNFEFGVTFNVTPVVGIQGEYGGNRLGSKSATIDLAPCPGCPFDEPTEFTANGWVHYGDVNLVLHAPWNDKKVQPYGLVGGGVYYRSANVTTPGVGYLPPYCDPWWYYCYPGGLVPVDTIVGSRSQTNFGMDFGGGVNIKIGESSAFYAEFRYHYVWGKKVTLPDGTSQSSTGQYMPLVFGFKF
jgi:opacity protein-like surface antigen